MNQIIAELSLPESKIQLLLKDEQYEIRVFYASRERTGAWESQTLFQAPVFQFKEAFISFLRTVTEVSALLLKKELFREKNP